MEISVNMTSRRGIPRWTRTINPGVKIKGSVRIYNDLKLSEYGNEDGTNTPNSVNSVSNEIQNHLKHISLH